MPIDIEVDVEIRMDGSIAHADDPLPRYLQQSLACGFGDLRSCSADGHDIHDDGKDQLTILFEVVSRPFPGEGIRF